MQVILFDTPDLVAETFALQSRSGTVVHQWNFGPVGEQSEDAFTPLCILHEKAWETRFSVNLEELALLRSGDLLFVELELTCDRVFLSPLSNTDRILYLARLKSLIRFELNKKTPDVAFFSATPHFPWDLCAEQVLRERGCRLFSLRPTHVDGRVSVVEHRSDPPRFRFVDRSEIDTLVSDRLPTNQFPFGKTKSEVSRRLGANYQQSRSQSRNQASYWTLLTETLRARRRILSQALRRASAPTSVAKKNLDYFSVIPWLDRKLLPIRQVRNTRKYLRLIGTPVEPDSVGEFIAFFMHFQPERSTDPEAGLSRFQVSSILKLRSMLDEEGLSELPILVKEHPRQWRSAGVDIRRVLSRSEEFYGTLLSVRGVQLVRSDYPSESFIKGASLVVTPNGSAAWEAACLAKPSLTFVETWHSSCFAAPNLDSLESSGRTLLTLMGMSEEDVESSLRQFWTNESVTHSGVINPDHVDQVDFEQSFRATGGLMARVAHRSL